jgi:CheY-like chemotaxis protein/anti-sigma regulatory factor (Ser/Thr protein kinase)
VGVRVLLVDDTVDVRADIVRVLEQHGGFELVGEAASLGEAVIRAGQAQPDVVVLDVRLPDLAGREVLTHIRGACPQARVVVFGDHDDTPWYAQHAEGCVPPGSAVDYLVGLLARVAGHDVRGPGDGHADGAHTVSERFVGEPDSVPSARRFVLRQVRDWRLARLCDEAALVVTELAANAVDHARSAFEVRLELTPAALRLEVCDNGAGTPEPQPPRRDSERGRGLLLVSAMSASWGIDDVVDDDGKVVWAELALERTA